MRRAFLMGATGVVLLASLPLGALAQDSVPPPGPGTTIIRPGESLALVYPERALARGVYEGRVDLLCNLHPDGRLSECEVVEETPTGMGFAAAALTGARHARISIPEGQPIPEGARMRLNLRFVAPEAEPPLARLEDPDWAISPRPDFPSAARRHGITTATVRLDCQSLRGTLRLQNCRVLEESHPGRGFGAAAIRSARAAAVSPGPMYNLGPDTRVIFTVSFEDHSPR
ncbi:energy transducer TonB [Brevundimonas sp.]|uniref:energy transducer TonB n=1 Tax=Brevundimonas sp. TaxID=1871086 RepID=UPI002EDB9CDC